MTHTKNSNYVNVFPEPIEGYNNTVNTSTGIAPAEVSAINQENIFLREWDRITEVHRFMQTQQLSVDDFWACDCKANGILTKQLKKLD